MMNLLPKKAENLVRHERVVHFTLIAAVLFSITLGLGIVLLIIPWFALTLQEHGIDSERLAISQSPSLTRVDELEDDIRRLNTTLEIYEKNRTAAFSAARMLERILFHNPDGVSLSVFSYDAPRSSDERPQFLLEGKARDRAALIRLSDALAADPIIDNVRSPISNLLKEKDIEFILTFEADVLSVDSRNE